MSARRPPRRPAPLRLATALALACASCGGSGASGREGPSASSLLSPDLEALTVEIDYQRGAPPFVGKAGQLADVWEISRDNLERMVRAVGARVDLPSSLDRMEELSDIEAGSFTSEAILDIAGAHRDAAGTRTAASLYVVFLDGHFEDASGIRQDVVGVSIGRTGVIAMFKPVIAAAESSASGIAKFVEQTTLVHEVGHALGLVDDGIADTSGHHDASHPHHCANEACAMYWANEGLSAAVAFARRFMRTGSALVLDAACLADLDGAAR